MLLVLLLHSLLPPLWQTLVPNRLQLGSAVTVSHTDRPLFRAFVFVWLAGGFAIVPHAGEPVPACYHLLSQTREFLKWPITDNT